MTHKDELRKLGPGSTLRQVWDEVNKLGAMLKRARYGPRAWISGFADMTRRAPARSWVLDGIMLAEDHPGWKVPFQVWLGIWDPEIHDYEYAQTEENTYWAIDLRYAVPYPDKCATGLAQWQRSNEYDWILEIVALDCESPGCEEY